MIHAKELRIGNNVLYSDKIITVESITKTGINIENYEEDNDDGEPQFYIEEYVIEHLDPIPITPEILEACGFENVNGETFSYNKNGLTLLWEDENNGIEIHKEWHNKVDYMFIENIKYLHQLQNLYFALTSEELKVNIHDKKEIV